jgi:hypothetical protein
MQAHEHTSFETPSLYLKGEILVHRTKVMIIYLVFPLHWSFEERVVRTVPWGDPESIRALLLDPSQDKFTVFCFDRPGMNPPRSSSGSISGTDNSAVSTQNVPMEHQTDPASIPGAPIPSNLEGCIKIFTLDNRSGTFQLTSDQAQGFPI